MHPLNIAHRGGADLKPENTMAAFADSIARGCDGVELDVHLSKDGVVVVHHDPRLDPRITRKEGVWLTGELPRIKDLTFAQLQNYDIGRPDPASDYRLDYPDMQPVEDARIPALSDVLAAARAAPDFLLFVELKTDFTSGDADPEGLADAVLAVMADDLDRAVFIGFDWRGLLRIKARAAQARCWFSTDLLECDLKPIIDGIAAAGADGWFPDFRNATPEAVVHARGKGLEVGAWTVNHPADMARLKHLDALCTDRPDLLAASGTFSA